MTTLIVKILCSVLFIVIPGFRIEENFRKNPIITVLSIIVGLFLFFWTAFPIYNNFIASKELTIETEPSKGQHGVIENKKEQNGSLGPETKHIQPLGNIKKSITDKTSNDREVNDSKFKAKEMKSPTDVKKENTSLKDENNIPRKAIQQFGSINSTVVCPAVGIDGTVYALASNDKFYAISPNGTQKWHLDIKTLIGGVEHVPAIGSDGTIYIGAKNDRSSIYALNVDGSIKWRFSAGCLGPRYITIGPNNMIYASVSDGTLYAINSDGTKKWAIPGNSYYNEKVIPSVDKDGIIYVGWSDGNLSAIYPDGSEKWKKTLSSRAIGPIIIGSKGVIYLVNGTSKLHAFNSEDGSIKWVYNTEDYYNEGSGYWISTPPSLGEDGTLYFCTQYNQHKVYAINPDGTTKWTYERKLEAFDTPHSPTIGKDGVIYVATGYHLYALNEDGTEKWVYKSNSRQYGPAVLTKDGTIYVGSGETGILAMYGHSRGLAQSSWPSPFYNSQNTNSKL